MKRRTFLASLIGLCLAPLAKVKGALTRGIVAPEFKIGDFVEWNKPWEGPGVGIIAGFKNGWANVHSGSSAFEDCYSFVDSYDLRHRNHRPKYRLGDEVTVLLYDEKTETSAIVRRLPLDPRSRPRIAHWAAYEVELTDRELLRDERGFYPLGRESDYLFYPMEERIKGVLNG